MSAELETPVLDELNGYLHFIAPRDYRRVHPLHEHLIRKRQIVVTENPGLHLIWHYDTIFIKPIPPFLLNFMMWRRFLLPPVKSVDDSTQQSSYPICDLQLPCKSALGFLRTYELLIRHPSDFNIAQTMNLIPQNISYFEFRAFIGPFHFLPDAAVAQRYYFGQMRLTRLNWAVRLLQPRMVRTGGWFANRLYYQELSTQSSEYILGFSSRSFTNLGNMGSSTNSGTGKEQAEESAPPTYSLVDDSGLVAELGNVQGRSSPDDDDLSAHYNTCYRRRSH
ncbi:hypothetical protein ACN42_g3592 [Penicillium freii]|uniref:Uncharacterized protein n=1 Tax=Penicillium freii TaxID=48697 RepID=A0A101MN22_PENFR|nr:hypothetical protein ACN42_g3592 [Penicillium freii]